jgi:hypothetical protein
LIGILIPLTPWMSRNINLTGDPFFSFTNTRNLVLDAIPGHSDLEMQLHAPVDLFEILNRFGGAILGKFLRNVVGDGFSLAHWANSFRGPYLFLVVVFLAALFHRPAGLGAAFARFKWSTLVLIIATFLLISLTVYSVRSYLMFRPLIYIVALAEIDSLLRRIRPPVAFVRLVPALLALLAIWQFGAALAAHRSSRPAESVHDENAYAALRAKLDRQAVVAADISEKISLRAGVRTVRLPAEPQELLEIDRDYLPIDYVLFSKDLWNSSLADASETSYHETYPDYVDFAASDPFLETFTFAERLPNGAMLFRKKGSEASIAP